MPTFKRYDGANFVDPANVRRYDGAAWQNVGFVRRWDGAAWQDVWPLEPAIVLPSAATLSETDTSAISSYAGAQFNSSGQLQYVNGQSLNWFNRGVGWMDPIDATKSSLFEVRWTKTGGSFNGSGMSSGVWYNMGTTRNKYAAMTTVGSNNVIGTIDIRRASDQQILATVTGIEFVAFRTS